MRVAVTSDAAPPTVAHAPVTTWPARKTLPLTVTVRDASGVKRVRLRYRSVNQHQDFHTMRMLPTDTDGEYRAEIPGAHIRPQWDFLYFIEVMDRYGNGAILPIPGEGDALRCGKAAT